MISWQQKESDRLLCAHESALHRNYVKKNENQFWINLFQDRQGDTKQWIPRDLAFLKNMKKDKNDLFYDQTYLNSRNFSCELYDFLQHK